MNNTFTVIVPMYNVQAYISECIESVIAQTYPRWELLIVDDESEDNSLNIARQYEKKDDRIKIITKKHGGLPQTRNYGLQQASGDYIVLLDGDDYFGINHLEKCNQMIGSGCDMCIVNNHINFTTAKKKKVVLFPYYEGINQFDKKEKLNIIFSLDNRLPASAVLTIYRRQFLLDNQIKYNEKYRCSEDLDFFLQNIIYAKNIIFANHEFYYYRQDNLGAMTKNITGNMLYDRLSIYEKWFQQYKDNIIDGFDGNTVVKLIRRDMRSSVILYHQIDRNDNNRKRLKCYINKTRYIWEGTKFKDSYFYNMVLGSVNWNLKQVYLKIKNNLKVRMIYDRQ